MLTYFLLFLSFSHYAYENDDLPSKMDVILNVFLATVAFLLVASQNLPTLPYLSTLDKVIMCNFTILLLEAVLAVAVKLVQDKIDNGSITTTNLGDKLNLYGMVATLGLCALGNLVFLVPAAIKQSAEFKEVLK